MKKTLIAFAATALLLVPAAASAHVTLQPDSVPAGGFSRLDVRVPNERDDASTEKVEVEFPDGFIFVSTEPVPGWKAVVANEKLATPIESHGEQITEQVKTVTWTAEDPAATIKAGEFRDFGISVGLPEDAAEGETLTFPAIQTYDTGEVVRWIGAADSEEPAPEVTLTAAEPEHGSGDTEEKADDGEDDDDGAKKLAVIALVLGAAGLGLGAAAFARTRK